MAMQAKKKSVVVDAEDSSTESIVEFSSNIADAEKPEPLPERDYPATIMKVEKKDNQNGDGQYFAVHFKVAEADYPADYPAENAPDGKTLIYRRVSCKDTAPNRWRVKRWCQAIGAPMSNRIEYNKWVGLMAKITVAHGEWEGEAREEITKVQELS